MKINIMPCRYPLKDGEWPKLMQAAAIVHGDEAHISQKPDDSDVHVFWGLRRPWGQKAMADGKRCLVIERAYLGDRFRWISMGFNGLNGHADFRNADVPDDRWHRHWSHQVRPWRDGGEYALVIGQVPGDAALRGLNIYNWCQQQVYAAKKRYGRVVFRPHPLAKQKMQLDGAEYSERTLAEDMAGAAVVITYNSNTAVDAVMAGVPAVAMDSGSMAYAVASHSVDDALYTGDRSDWGRRIAYAQWLPEEVEDGTAWGHLRHG